MDLKETIGLMREYEVIKWKTKEFEIEITKESIARHHYMKHKKNVEEQGNKEKNDKMKMSKRKDELREFVYGKDKIERQEMGELYGI